MSWEAIVGLVDPYFYVADAIVLFWVLLVCLFYFIYFFKERHSVFTYFDRLNCAKEHFMCSTFVVSAAELPEFYPTHFWPDPSRAQM